MRRALFLALLLALTATLLGVDGSEGPSLSADFYGEYERYSVAADHPAASEAGAQILAEGGNAADAAAATMLALGVASPASSGLGGGGFALYYRASDQSLTYLDFRERAPAAATPDMFQELERGEGPAAAASQLGGLASGVPGEPAGIEELVRRFGSLSLSRIVRPAVRLAEQGVEVSAGVSRMSGVFGGQMRQDPLMRTWFSGEESALAVGSRLRQPELGRTLRAIGRQGARAIYHGRIAREIVAANRRAGGVFTLQDLADYSVVEREPLSQESFGHRFVTAPPPSAGGFTMLQSLAVLERLPARHFPRDGSAAYYHAIAESWKGPFLDRRRYFGDPDHVALPLEALADPARLDALAATFHPTLAGEPALYDLPVRPVANVVQPEDHGTSHLCVVDAEGNIASITTTVNLPFGARYTAAGMVMNDEMDDFARAVGEANAFGLVGGAANLPAPGKRMVSSMSPTIIFRNGRPIACVGAAGGSRIVTAVQQVAMNIVLRGMSASDALAAPRIHHQAEPNQFRYEEFAPLDAGILERLRRRGHVLDQIHHVAAAQVIGIEEREGQRILTAASDPRKGGRPAGL